MVYNLQYMVEPRSEMALPMTMLQKKNNPMLCFVGEGGLQSAPDFAAERCIDSTTKIMMMMIWHLGYGWYVLFYLIPWSGKL